MYERQGDDVQCEACWRKWAETAVCEHCKAIVVDLRFHDVQVGNYVEPHYECGIGGPEWDPGYRTPECWQRQVDALQAIVDKLSKTADGVSLVGHRGPLWLCGYNSDGMVECHYRWSLSYQSSPGEWSVQGWDGATEHNSYLLSECYSTREAAEAAKEKTHV